MKKSRLYLIDATAFCYRAFYAIRGLATSFGQPSGAVYGFINMLNKILKSHKPDFLGVCFDVSRDTFRQKKFQEYKIQRPPMPNDLTSQMPLIRELIEAHKFTIFEQEGYEADDVIATLVKKAKAKGLDVTIVSADKDIMQLIENGVEVFSPHKDEGAIYTEAEVKEHFGVSPKQIVDIIALMGDTVDNIPGVKGIGEKTAVELIRQFASVNNLLANIDKIKTERLRKLIQENIPVIKLSYELASLNDNLEIKFSPEDLRPKEPDYQKLLKLYKYLEFKSLVKELPIKEEEVTHSIKDLADDDIPSRIKGNQLFISFEEGRGILISESSAGLFCVKPAGSQIAALLSSSQVTKIGFDIKALKLSLFNKGMSLEGPYFDAKIIACLINPAHSGYSLAELAWEHLGINVRENLDKAHELSMLLELRPKLEGLLKERELDGLYNSIEMPLIDVLAEMEKSGVSIDLDFLKKLSSQIEKSLISLIEKIYDLSGTQFNINSPKQLADVLFNKLKLPVIKRSKTGPSTNEEVLKALAKLHELPVLLLEYRSLTKLKNTYIDALPQLVDRKTNRIHTSFNQIGAETGRMSSENPNLQNIPVKTELGRQIRKAIVASQNKGCLVASDYSQIELRVLAHISGDEVLIKAFKEDKDIHKFTSSLLYNTDEGSVTGEMREVAKRINFGIIYGLSPFGLANDLKIPHEEARVFIDEYFLRYPGVKDYINNQISRAKKDGFVTTLLGRRRYLPDINNKNQAIRQFAERQAVNTPIQGSAADLIKLAMVNIHKEIKEKNIKSRMILQVHDELVFDVVQDEANDIVSLVKMRMENVFELKVPIRVSIKKGKNWLEMEEAK